MQGAAKGLEGKGQAIRQVRQSRRYGWKSTCEKVRLKYGGRGRQGEDAIGLDFYHSAVVSKGSAFIARKRGLVLAYGSI